MKDISTIFLSLYPSLKYTWHGGHLFQGDSLHAVRVGPLGCGWQAANTAGGRGRGCCLGNSFALKLSCLNYALIFTVYVYEDKCNT